MAFDFPWEPCILLLLPSLTASLCCFHHSGCDHMWTHMLYMLYYYKVSSLSHVQLLMTPWTVAHQSPLSMEIFRQEFLSGLPFPSPGDLPDRTRVSCIIGRFFTTSATWEAQRLLDIISQITSCSPFNSVVPRFFPLSFPLIQGRSFVSSFLPILNKG